MLCSNVNCIPSRVALFYLAESNLFSDMGEIFLVLFYRLNFRKVENMWDLSHESVAEKIFLYYFDEKTYRLNLRKIAKKRPFVRERSHKNWLNLTNIGNVLFEDLFEKKKNYQSKRSAHMST